ncbi:MAG: family phage terminase small subunit [Devosia sp.]|uniref:P27 family phage terminase small subunit n=1 Tax=Devosia sp. TaxID=1871048 RepID=UPI002637B7D9|nr:P27 family phage terminase small subunit [Devosia sp.]MDB5540537.1 family phage terminase small subunit [Devosia sp.]
MNVIENTGAVVPEPDWDSLFSDVLEIAAAKEHWRVVTTELRDRQLLAPGNAHALQRLVVDYILYDRAAREVAENGAVTKPKRGNPKAIARTSPHFTVMREAASDAAVLEQEFGLSPRRRAAATKVPNGKKAARAADGYLSAVK